MSTSKICIIGCGNLGLSLTKGLMSNKNFDNTNLIVTKRNINSILYLQKDGITVTGNNIEAVKNSEIIILSVKPYNQKNILKEIAPILDSNKHILVSVAAGISINDVRENLSENIPIFSAMPNTAAKVGETITCIAYHNEEYKKVEDITEIFNYCGQTQIIDEQLMEAATILGACGIAYVMRFIRAMIQGGIQIGFDSETAKKIVTQTVKGAADILMEQNQHPESEIDKVTTPKGCTIVGLNEMEHNGFSSSLIKGIVQSFKEIEK